MNQFYVVPVTIEIPTLSGVPASARHALSDFALAICDALPDAVRQALGTRRQVHCKVVETLISRPSPLNVIVETHETIYNNQRNELRRWLEVALSSAPEPVRALLVSRNKPAFSLYFKNNETICVTAK